MPDATPDSGKPESACVPASGEDVPDDEFVDSDCDGFDGNAGSAVFVTPTGTDDAAGTPEAPVKTLGKAVGLAKAASKDVYVCNGTYAENVVLEDSGLRMFGGYDCENGWVRTKGRALVNPGTGVPMRIDGADGTVLDRIELEAPAGVDPGESSIALIVNGTSGVGLNRVSITSNEGGDGSVGVAPVAMTAAKSGANGVSTDGKTCVSAGPKTGSCATTAAGGYDSTFVQCVGVSIGYRGGKGGTGGNINQNKPATSGGAGYFAGALGGKVGFGGSPGDAGAIGVFGIPGIGIGTIVDGNYVASNAGTNGTLGLPGEAGGGGAGGTSKCLGDVCGSYTVGGGGGQGGYPGCGGEGGKAGGGGGASIGILSIDSVIQITWSDVHTKTGGAGGSPSDGAQGQPGGAGGKGGSGSLAGQPGGAGGPGGKGGPGGPGGGGPSIGILVQGAVPTTEAITFDIASGGEGASGIAGPAAEDGKSADILSLDTSTSDAGTN